MKWKLLLSSLAITSTAIAQQHELTIAIVGANQAEIRWPAKPGGYYLEYKTLLPGSTWTALDATPTEITGTFRISIPLSDTARYFRLTTGPNIVYVDATAGSDRNTGAVLQPVATIERALQLAANSTRKDIYVAKGAYNLNGGTLSLIGGVNLRGSLDPANAWTRSANIETFIVGGPVALEAINLAAPTTLEGFSIEAAAASAPGESSYGIIAANSQLTIRNNIIIANEGRAGQDAPARPAAADANRGLNGGPGSCDSNNPGAFGLGGTSDIGRAGGAGGRGGTSGARGANALAGSGGALGGQGGNFGNPGVRGQNGIDGARGTHGSNGSLPASAWSISNNRFLASAGLPGIDGTPGHGAGGGGGGGGQDCFACQEGAGNGGGGGGAGAPAGLGAVGGQGGGASLGLLIIGGNVTAENNTINVQSGGNGGKGGNGGAGGRGGDPGLGGVNCITDVGGGGNGGRGGDGGSGGNGSGGAGGPSIGILVLGQAQLASNTITHKSGGLGGPGGSNNAVPAAPAGPAGAAAAIIVEPLP